MRFAFFCPVVAGSRNERLLGMPLASFRRARQTPSGSQATATTPDGEPCTRYRRVNTCAYDTKGITHKRHTIRALTWILARTRFLLFLAEVRGTAVSVWSYPSGSTVGCSTIEVLTLFFLRLLTLGASYLTRKLTRAKKQIASRRIIPWPEYQRVIFGTKIGIPTILV